MFKYCRQLLVSLLSLNSELKRQEGVVGSRIGDWPRILEANSASAFLQWLHVARKQEIYPAIKLFPFSHNAWNVRSTHGRVDIVKKDSYHKGIPLIRLVVLDCPSFVLSGLLVPKKKIIMHPSRMEVTSSTISYWNFTKTYTTSLSISYPDIF